MKPTSQTERCLVTAGTPGSCGGRDPLAGVGGVGKKLDGMLRSVSRKVEVLGRWKVSLAATIAIILIVIGARYYYSFVTGYIVPDEAWYYNTFILEKSPISSYRQVFVATFILFFGSVHDVWTFLLLGALYSAIWAVGCALMVFMILRRLRVPESMSSLLILSLPLFPVYIVFVPTVLTETLGLFLALVGVYFGLRHVQDGRVVDNLLSVAFFFLAYKVRESYLLFAVGNILLFLILAVKRRSLASTLLSAVLVSVVFPVPVRLEPPTFALPVYAWVVNLMSGGYQPPNLAGSFTVPVTAAMHPDLLRAIVIGLAYGFNPLFALFAVFSILAVCFDVFRRRSSTSFFLALNAVWSLGAFAVPALVLLELMPGALSGWTSAIIRATHPSLPCIVGFPSLYGRLRVKRVAALMVILLILGSTQVSSFVGAFQRSLSREPVDRLSLDYRAPYYRMYVLAKESGKTLVFGGMHMRAIRMYMVMLPNVALVPVWGRADPGALTETGFRAWLAEQNWDSIILYDDWVTIKIPSWIDAYPQFYSDILRSRQYTLDGTQYTVETLWIDGESYALKMVKETGSNSGSPA